jgi:alpha-beta hydrolase superfamily lysophospholipase
VVNEIVPLAYEARLHEWLVERGMSYQRLSYRRDTAGGTTVAHRFSPAAPPTARVLVAHGAGNDALFSFPGFFKQLLIRGFEVFSFDLDGHGRSSTTTLSAAAITGAVGAALEQARATHAELQVHAVGVSLGGSVLLQALPSLTGTVASAVLIAAPLRIRFSLRAVLAELGPPLVRVALQQREHLGLWGLIPSFGPVKRGAYPLRLAEARPGAFGYVEILNEMLEQMRLEDAARSVQVPALLVYGTGDRLVPPEQGERLRRLIRDSELLIVPGGTHLTTFFADPATERIYQWLEAAAHKE